MFKEPEIWSQAPLPDLKGFSQEGREPEKSFEIFSQTENRPLRIVLFVCKVEV